MKNTMTIEYEFITKDEATIRGKITGVPDFDISTRAGYKRVRRLIEAWAGEGMWETLKLEAYNQAAAKIRRHMAKTKGNA